MGYTYAYQDPSEDDRYRCRHIFTDGHRCGSPCLRNEEFCYYHHTTRLPIQDAAARKARLGTFELNPADLSDRSGVLHAIALVLERIAANELDPRRAGLLLYGLQTAVIALPKPQPNAEPPLIVDEISEDPALGTLAPREQIRKLVRKGSVALLLEKLRSEDHLEDTEEVYPADLAKARAASPKIVLPEVQAVAAPASQHALQPTRRTLPATHLRSSGPAMRLKTARLHPPLNLHHHRRRHPRVAARQIDRPMLVEEVPHLPRLEQVRLAAARDIRHQVSHLPRRPVKHAHTREQALPLHRRATHRLRLRHAGQQQRDTSQPHRSRHETSNKTICKTFERSYPLAYPHVVTSSTT